MISPLGPPFSSNSANLRPKYKTGAKTLLYEIAEQMDWNLPPVINVVMALDEEDVWRFLGGVIDGDWSFNQESSRLHIYVGQEDLLEAVLVACLRLGIVPQVTRNRTIYNVQIVEQVERLLGYTHRVQGEVRQHQKGTRPSCWLTCLTESNLPTRLVLTSLE